MKQLMMSGNRQQPKKDSPTKMSFSRGSESILVLGHPEIEQSTSNSV